MAISVLLPGAASAQGLAGHHQEHPNFDRRLTAGPPAAVSSAKVTAKGRLNQQLRSVKVDFDPLVGSPKYIRSHEGFLTGPNGRGRTVSEQAARAVSNEPHAPVKAFINEHSALFGHDARVLNNARTKREGIDSHNGLRTVIWQQQLDGLDVYQAVFIGHTTAQGELVSVASTMLPDPASAANAGNPNRAALQAAPAIPTIQAIQLAALNLGDSLTPEQIQADGGPVGDGDYLVFKTPARVLARLVWLPLSASSLRLSWEVHLTRNTNKETFRLVLDAETGEVYLRDSLTCNISDATYNVFTSDSPSPFSPGLPTPGNFQPPLVPRTMVTTPALDVTASPDGWIPDGGNTTTGNNVDAFPDRDFDFAPDAVGRPQGNPNRVFDLPLDLTQDPSNYVHASTVQFFYKANWYHDRLYQLGFTEAFGNFQQNNFGRGGLGGDPVIAYVQAGADLGIANNAFFATAPDGVSGQCAMFIWDFPDPARDGSLDSEVIMHELTHGTSWRLVGGGMVLGNLQGDGMGEGWSDFYPFCLLSEPADDPNGVYVTGGYVTYLLGGLNQNYYFGIRRYPYSTDMTKNPLTFKDIDPAQIGSYPGIPRSPISPFDPREASEVHNSGEIWCIALWEVRANLVMKYGWAVGNELALQLVTDGMKLTPPFPNFLQARDAILLSDRINNGGANVSEIWRGFAKRGMGVSATSPNGTTTAGVKEAFDVPGLFVEHVVVLGGNDNRVIDPNECDDLQIYLANISGYLATGVSATLSTTNPAVIVVQPNSQYPVLPNNSTNANLTPFRVSIAPYFVCGMPIDFMLVVKSDQDTTTNFFTMPTGVPAPPLRYDTDVPVLIPDNDLTGTNSPIVVSNFVGALTKVAVSLHITHTYDQDLTLQLISPGGITNTLSANNGFNGNGYGIGCTDNLRTTFDDDATNAIAASNPPYIGSFAPDEPLTIFNGSFDTNVNGTWLLRMVDDAGFDIGTLQCWSLFLSSAECLDGGGECPGADMAVGMSAMPEPVLIGENLVYTISVTNRGPSTAKNVIVTQLLPTSAIFVSGTSSQGTVAQSGGVVTANLGLMNARQTATVTIVAFPTLAGLASSTATVSSDQTDFNPLNNSATVLSKVNPPTADLALGLAASSKILILGQSFDYTVAVTNRGPSAAGAVMVTNILPAGVVYVSSSTSQGMITVNSNVVVCSFGSITNGGRALATITALASAEGSQLATSLVRGNQFDPISTNNFASVEVAVGPAADLAIGLLDNPDPVVVRSNYTYLVSVTNLGPSIATGVIVNQTLPAGVTIVSTNTTQGTVTVSGANVIANLGTLTQGASASITVRLFSPITTTNLSSATVSATQPDPNAGNNTASASTVVMPPVVTIVAAGATLTSESVLPVNGAVDLGEQVTVILRLRNSGNVNTTNLFATLLATNGVTPVGPNDPQRYGVLPPSGFPVGKSFTFIANGTNGGNVTAWLELTDGSTTYPPVPFQFGLPRTHEFFNTNTIVIHPIGAASPYPSTNIVANVTGAVSHVAASIYNFSHTYPRDVGILLVGPKGTKTLLMASASNQGFLTSADLTFDDLAAAPLPDFGAIASGTWQPTAYSSPAFPLPAPAAPYQSALASFNSVDPNGVWSLYVVDELDGDSGGITNGWGLKITTLSPVNQVADLALSIAASPANVLAGSNLVYTFSVTNAGPNPASFVAFTNLIPAGLSLVSAQTSQGILVTNSTSIIANLDTLNTGKVATITAVLTPTAANAGFLTNSAVVAASETDLNLVNNAATLVTTVGLPVADLAVSQVASPEPVLVGSNITFTISVTNSGPGLALDVVLTNPIPAGLSLVSASSTVGTVLTPSGAVVWNIGTLAPQMQAALTLVAGTATVGQFTNVAVLAARSQDPAPADNTAALVVSVVNPAPVIVSASATLVSESFSPPNGTVEPGETVTVALALKNVGSADTANLMATLQPTGGVSPVGSAQKSYGQLVFNGDSRASDYTFTASGPNAGIVTASLNLQDGAANLGNVSFAFNLPAQTAFTNSTPIIVADHGPALPYPSTIEVTGLTGEVSRVTVSAYGIYHSFPRDLNALLVSPAGAKMLLMAHAGGAHALTNVTLTFDDSAAALPGTNRINSGTYKPSAYGSVPAFPAPAPAAPYATTLAAANGGTANGTWSLYILDDSVGDGGSISGGWSLDITTVAPVNPVADLAIGIAGGSASFYLGGMITNVISLTNLGPANVTGVSVSSTFPTNIHLVSAESAQGSVSTASGQVNWSVGDMNSAGSAVATIVLQPTLGGTFTLTSAVSAAVIDLNPANSTAQRTFTAIEPVISVLTGSFENGTFNINMTGEPGMNYLIQGSTNLTSWSTLGMVTVNPGGTAKYPDTNAPAFNSRYYRSVRVVP